MSRRSYKFWLLPSVSLIIAADQVLKFWVNQHLRILDRRPILGQNFLIVSRILNRGIAGDTFSWIPQGSIEPYTRYLPTLVLGMIAVISVVRYSRKSAHFFASQMELLGLVFLVAGGASNLFNHWTADFVTDPLQLYIGSGEYLPFNIADVAIIAGAVLVLWSIGAMFKAQDCPTTDTQI